MGRFDQSDLRVIEAGLMPCGVDCRDPRGEPFIMADPGGMRAQPCGDIAFDRADVRRRLCRREGPEQAAHARKRLEPVRCLCRDNDIAGRLENFFQAIPDDRVIVCEQDADHQAGSATARVLSGISIWTTVPPVSGEKMRADPPSVRARSLMPSTPKDLRPGSGLNPRPLSVI